MWIEVCTTISSSCGDRFVDLLPANWVFVVICVLLRIVEGIGTALLFTVTFTVLPILFPNSVATLMVHTGALVHVGGEIIYLVGKFLNSVITGTV